MKTIKYEPGGGETIQHSCAEAVKLARDQQCEVFFNFNDIRMLAQPDTDPEVLAGMYMTESNRRHEEWLASPEYAEQQRQMDEQDRRKRIALEFALTQAPLSMTFADEAGWKLGLEKNQDPYGHAIYEYADLWARIMEGRMARGAKLEDIANECSHTADVDGLTGFMYGAAVAILAKAWIHGDALRKWHNLKTQLKDEGEKANATGAVLNPAMLVMGSNGG